MSTAGILIVNCRRWRNGGLVRLPSKWWMKHFSFTADMVTSMIIQSNVSTGPLSYLNSMKGRKKFRSSPLAAESWESLKTVGFEDSRSQGFKNFEKIISLHLTPRTLDPRNPFISIYETKDRRLHLSLRNQYRGNCGLRGARPFCGDSSRSKGSPGLPLPLL